MPLSSLLGWHWCWDSRHLGSSSSSRSNSGACNALPHTASAPAGGSAGGLAHTLSGSLMRAASGSLVRAGSASNTQSLTPQPSLHAPHPCRVATAATAATRHGHLALLGKGAELVRLSLATDAEAAPQLPLAVYDWELAGAAHAAACAMEQQQLRAWAVAAAAPARRSSVPAQLEGAASTGLPSSSSLGLQGPLASAEDSSGGRSREQQGAVGNPGDSSSKEAGQLAAAGGSAGSGRPDLKGFMNKIGADFHRAGGGVARGFQKALDETSKGLQKVAQVCSQLTITCIIGHIVGHCSTECECAACCDSMDSMVKLNMTPSVSTLTWNTTLHCLAGPRGGPRPARPQTWPAAAAVTATVPAPRPFHAFCSKGTACKCSSSRYQQPWLEQ